MASPPKISTTTSQGGKPAWVALLKQAKACPDGLRLVEEASTLFDAIDLASWEQLEWATARLSVIYKFDHMELLRTKHQAWTHYWRSGATKEAEKTAIATISHLLRQHLHMMLLEIGYKP